MPIRGGPPGAGTPLVRRLRRVGPAPSVRPCCGSSSCELRADTRRQILGLVYGNGGKVKNQVSVPGGGRRVFSLAHSRVTGRTVGSKAPPCSLVPLSKRAAPVDPKGGAPTVVV